MKNFKLGKIFGIELQLNPSWFAIFLLITVALIGQFGTELKGLSPIVSYTVGAVTSLLFFLSLILHELSHCLVARAYRIKVRSITLHLFGGVSQMEQEPARPLEEFLIAAAGPAMSLALGLIFLGSGYLVGDRSHTFSFAATQLGGINVMLALFNLVPGYPLDGGRILRSIIWGIKKDFRKATRLAAIIGQGVAGLFMMFGLYLLLTGEFQGLWLGFIGFYLLGMARTSYQQVELQHMLRGVTVGNLTIEDLPQVSGRTPITDFLKQFVIGVRNRHYMIVDDNTIRGVVSLRKLQSMEEEGKGWLRVEDGMTPINSLQRIEPETELIDALEAMTKSNSSQLPVVKNNELLGFIGRDSLLNYIRSHFQFGVQGSN